MGTHPARAAALVAAVTSTFAIGTATAANSNLSKVKLAETSPYWHGNVYSVKFGGVRSCERDRTVRVFKRRDGKDLKIGSDVSSKSGRWSVPDKPTPGIPSRASSNAPPRARSPAASATTRSSKSRRPSGRPAASSAGKPHNQPPSSRVAAALKHPFSTRDFMRFHTSRAAVIAVAGFLLSVAPASAALSPGEEQARAVVKPLGAVREALTGKKGQVGAIGMWGQRQSDCMGASSMLPLPPRPRTAPTGWQERSSSGRSVADSRALPGATRLVLSGPGTT